MEKNRHKDEILTDNTKIKYCIQCKRCKNWGHTNAFGNAFDKACCDKYPYPAHKPAWVLNNAGDCEYREVVMDGGSGRQRE